MRVTVAGLGPRGRQWVEAVRTTPGCELAAVVEVDPTIVTPFAPRYDRLEDALQKAPSDAVVVASGPAHHVELCQTALAHRQALLVEKPFTLRLDEAQHVMRLAEEGGLPVVVGMNYRYTRCFRTVRKVVDSGVLGRIHLATLEYHRVPHPMAPALEELDHSVLWGMGIHHLDALRWCLQDEVRRVLATSFCRPGNREPRGRSMQMLLELVSGARVSYTASYESSGHQYFGQGQEFYQRLTGDKGTLHVLFRWLILCLNGKLPRIIWRGRKTITEERLLLEQLAGLRPRDASGQDNLHTMAVMEAIQRSADSDAWVEL